MAKILVRIKNNSGTYQKKFRYASKKILVRIKKNSGTHQKNQGINFDNLWANKKSGSRIRA
jgi:hypothetical protein